MQRWWPLASARAAARGGRGAVPWTVEHPHPGREQRFADGAAGRRQWQRLQLLHHRRARRFPNRDCRRQRHRDANLRGNTDAHAHRHGGGHTEPDADQYRVAFGDADSYGDVNRLTDPNADTPSQRDTDGQANPDPLCHGYPDAYRDAVRHELAEPDIDTHRRSYSYADRISDAHPD
jgi:hypothetical protein